MHNQPTLSSTPVGTPSIAVAFLARGSDVGSEESCERFLKSYQQHSAGIDHCLYILYKGFTGQVSLDNARDIFKPFPHVELFLPDDSFDIGAYIAWANQINERFICAFNTASEILAENWLKKLYLNLCLPKVGLVGATGSYESLSELNYNFPSFPNIHLRSTSFMIERKLFCTITQGLSINNKIDAYFAESGKDGFTKKVLATGKKVLIVGRNGRGYSPEFWNTSDTFRQGSQDNLLVADNQTRHFSALSWSEKRAFAHRTWGY